MTVIASDQEADGEGSGTHTIITDITSIVASGQPWGRARVIALIETAVASGIYRAVPDWEMRGPGAMDFVTNGVAGLRLRFLTLGITENYPAKISVDAS